MAPLLKRILGVLQMRNTDKIYEIVENPLKKEDDHWCILVKETKFAGLIYKYNEVSFRGNDKTDPRMTLQFSYDVLDLPPSLMESELTETEEDEFTNLLGDILVNIMEDEFELNEQEGDDGSRRISYTEKSDAERVLYKKSDSVSEV